MASMSDAQDRWRILEKLNDSLVALETNYTPVPLGAEGPPNVSEAWAELREVVQTELEAAREAVA